MEGYTSRVAIPDGVGRGHPAHDSVMSTASVFSLEGSIELWASPASMVSAMAEVSRSPAVSLKEIGVTTVSG